MINSFLLKNPAVPKSIHVLIVLLALTSFSTAQTPQYYNYNTSSGSSNSFPFNISAGKKVQLLYLPGDFNQPAPAPVGRITSIYFRINDNYPLGPWTYTDLTIKMGQSEITSFASGEFYTGTLDTVYHKASVLLSGTAGQWMIIPLDTSFLYDPEKSLIVDVGQCGVPGATGFSMSFTNLSGYRRNWSTGGCPFTYSGQNYTVYHIGLDICPVPPAPANTTPPANQTICSENTTTLNASGTGILGWYNEATGGLYLGSGTSYTTPVLTKDTVFYVQDNICGFPSSRTAITVTANPVYTFSEDQSICEGNTYSWQGADYTETGTYTDRYTSVTGCDSMYTLNLTVNSAYSFAENYSICEGNTYSWQGADYTETGTYTARYTSVTGCDSMYTLNLTVNSAYSFAEDYSICEGNTYSWQGADYTETGTYTARYTSVTGCDSIYTLNLTVNQVYIFTENHSICNGETYYWQGKNYAASGVYSESYTNIFGCDSMYTLYLAVNSVDVSVTVDNDVITANATGGVFQWLDCNNSYAPINGAISQSYSATENGNYSVVVTQGLCSDTSACIPITNVGIGSFSPDRLTIYPNPVSDELIIEIKGNNVETNIEILNLTGQVVYRGIVLQKTVIKTSEFTTGVYLVKINNGKSYEFKKIIKD